MKTSTILDAIEKLDEAGRGLRAGNLCIKAQMDLGMECYRAATHLRSELEADVPTLKVSDAQVSASSTRTTPK